MVGPPLRDAAAWCGRALTYRWLLVVTTAATLAAATLSCVSGLHLLYLIPCYWDMAQWPGRVAMEVLQAAVRSLVRVAAELAR